MEVCLDGEDGTWYGWGAWGEGGWDGGLNCEDLYCLALISIELWDSPSILIP